MNCRLGIQCVGLHLFLLSAICGVNAAEPNPLTDAAGLVEEALEAEAEGDFLTRQRLLVEAQNTEQDFAPAQWLRGQIQADDGSWESIETSVQDAADDKVLAMYEANRAKLPDNLASHWAMARWCGEQGLGAQRRSHLSQVLIFDPDNREARAELGYRMVGGEWLSAQQVRQVAERSEWARQSVATFGDALQPIAAGLLSTDKSIRSEGAAKLMAIQDPAAVPAVEALLASPAVDASRVVVEWLGKIDTVEASQVLARYSLLHPQKEIRTAAVAKLQQRPLFDFVPDLLSMLSSPVNAMLIPSFERGRLTGYRQAFAQEKFDKIDFVVVDRTFDRQRTAVAVTGAGGRVLADLQNQAVNAQVQELATAEARLSEVARQRENSQVLARNARISEVLSQIASREFDDAQSMWKWWDEVNETGYQQFKPERYRRNSLSTVVPEYRRVSCECFVAETQVMTRRGLRPITQVVVGDTVLSRDVLTSELSWKPVLRTTTRPPEKIAAIRVGKDELRCTTGHLFWVSGQGWKKASELKPGDVLHAAEEPMVVVGTQEQSAEPTFNLEVADNATYFVGHSLVMTHDVTPRTAGRQGVPGQLFVARR